MGLALCCLRSCNENALSFAGRRPNQPNGRSDLLVAVGGRARSRMEDWDLAARYEKIVKWQKSGSGI